MSFFRLTAEWAGPGGPGYSRLLYKEADAATVDPSDVQVLWSTYFAELSGYLPNDWSISISSEVEQVSDAGVIEGLLTATGGGGGIAGTHSGPWAGAVGVVTRFATGEVLPSGRTLVGKTYFVPAGSDTAFDNDGTLNGTCLTDFTTNRVDLHDGMVAVDAIPVVWSPTHGLTAPITSISVADRSAVLRSRRD